MLKYHTQYTHGFVFVFEGTSQAALNTVKDMYDVVSRTADALGPNAGNTREVAVEAYASLLRRIQGAERGATERQKSSYVPVKPNPPQRLLLRRMTARVLPEQVLKLFAR